ncbi:MAG: hypothetical protein JOY68_06530 [Candidatus Dormibacteraeota bacterium]|nr:hypothetical protein [Candidatus Dormibacteraeota bacterium]
MAPTTRDDDETEAVDPQESALTAVDPEALLDGEDPDSQHPDDVAHWITAYTELVGYKERLLAASEEDRAGMQTRSARKETAEVDVPILSAELGRYRRRLAFWERRKVEIASGGS